VWCTKSTDLKLKMTKREGGYVSLPVLYPSRFWIHA
jgi:hypothetical protein